MASSPPPEPDPTEVTRIAGEVGEYVAHLSPPTNWQTLMIVYGALFLGLCKELDISPTAVLPYIVAKYEMGVEKVYKQ